MSPSYLSYVVCLTKLRNYIAAEEKAGSSGTHAPSGNFFGITPHQITHGSVVRHFLFSVNGFYLIQCVETWRESAMHTEDFVIDYRSQWQKVEYFCAVSPYVY